MSWENTLNMVSNYESMINKYFNKMEAEKAYVETFNIPNPTKKKTFKGFSTDILFLNIKEHISYIKHKKFTSYYWNDYFFLEYRIVELTPEQFLRYTYMIEDKQFTNIEDIFKRQDIIEELVDEYVEKINNGDKFNLPYIEFIEKIFDGRHRALAAYKAGLKSIPCMIFI